MKLSTYLAVNTSQSFAQLALFNNETVLGNSTWEKEKSHSEVITTAFSDLLNKTSQSLSDISGVVCVNGPGSFTGLRVGLNFAKSLAYSINCKMSLISSLDLLSLNPVINDGRILSAIDAQKNSIFFSIYDVKSGSTYPVIQNQLLEVSQLKEIITENVILSGPGLNNYWNEVNEDTKNLIQINPNNDSMNLLNLLEQRNWISWEPTIEWFKVQPLYIKASAPEEKLNPTKTSH